MNDNSGFYFGTSIMLTCVTLNDWQTGVDGLGAMACKRVGRSRRTFNAEWPQGQQSRHDSNIIAATGNSRHYRFLRRKEPRHHRKSSNLLFTELPDLQSPLLSSFRPLPHLAQSSDFNFTYITSFLLENPLTSLRAIQPTMTRMDRDDFPPKDEQKGSKMGGC